jgi:mRNA interferase RelE/StbE
MPQYSIFLTKKTQKQLDTLSNKISNAIIEAIYTLEDNPRPFGYKKLKGRTGCRIRVGDYRIIYEIFDSELIVTVIALGHRKNIYK